MSLELITYENSEGRETARRIIRDGIAGNYEVVYEMIRLIRSSNTDYRVKNIAAELLTERGFTSYASEETQLRAIFNYVKNSVKYVMDIAGAVESVKSAHRTLLDGFGDCDDLTVTVCSLAGALGFERVAVALAKYSQNETSFSHVYPVIYTRGGARYVLDVSLPDAQFNAEVKPFEIREIFVFDTVKGLDGVSGIWTNTRNFAKKIGNATLKAIPNAVEYLPLGFAGAVAFSGGAQLLNTSNKSSKSFSEIASEINRKLETIINQLVRGEIALDLAQTYAAQSVAQFSLIDDIPNAESYTTVKASVYQKLAFIKNYEAIAKANGLPVVYLNANAMFLLGASGAAYGAYQLYKFISQR
jgi:hypothetical protein